jgi:hypothetical protein
MEVLASMFVICIGLLGVLAVIPYGAYQTAKAKNAENTAWLLDAAVKDLQAMELAKPENWTQTQFTLGATLIFDPTSADKELNCSKFFMIDPFNDVDLSLDHIYRIGATFTHRQLFRDRMTGQDDLVYTIHTDKRTDFSGQNNKILSSGQYTWFFMFRPNVSTSYLPGGNPPTSLLAVPWTYVESNVDIDILGCYNRVPGIEQSIPIIIPPSPPPLPYSVYNSNSILVNIPYGDYDWKNTKYVFLSWLHTSEPRSDGGWYKVINVMESTGSTCDVFLTHHVGSTYPELVDFQILIIPGVMYHKRISATIK